MSPVKLSGLGRRLVKESLLTEEAASEAIALAKKEKKSFIHYVVEQGLVDGRTVATLAANEFGSPVLDLASYDFSYYNGDLLRLELVLKHQAVPLYKRGSRLYVAMCDPTNLHALDEIKFNTGLNVEAIVVEAMALQHLLQQVEKGEEDQVGSGLDDLDEVGLDDLDIEAVDEDSEEGDVNVNQADETPVVRFINKVLVEIGRASCRERV